MTPRPLLLPAIAGRTCVVPNAHVAHGHWHRELFVTRTAPKVGQVQGACTGDVHRLCEHLDSPLAFVSKGYVTRYEEYVPEAQTTSRESPRVHSSAPCSKDRVAHVFGVASPAPCISAYFLQVSAMFRRESSVNTRMPEVSRSSRPTQPTAGNPLDLMRS